MFSVMEATMEDCISFWGKPPVCSFKGIVAKRDGKVIGIGGLFFDGTMPIAWTEHSAEMTKRERAVAARIMASYLDDFGKPVYAFAQPDIPTSHALLMKLGFEKTGVVREHGELLRRAPQQGGGLLCF